MDFSTQTSYNSICSICFSIDADENLVESEYEDDDDNANGTTAQRKSDGHNENATRISWLLQVALESLGVTVSSYIVRIRLFSTSILFCRTKQILHAFSFEFHLDADQFGRIGAGATSKPTDYFDDGTALHLD